MKSYRQQVARAFGQALREVRTASGLSQEELALESGVDRTFVSMLERGIRQPALATVLLLGEHLKTTPGALVDDTARRMNKASAGEASPKRPRRKR